MHVIRYADAAGARSYHAALVVAEPHGRLAPHGHADFHELVYVVHGHGWHQLSGHRQQLATGDLVLVRPRDVHTFGPGKGDLRFVNIAFPTERWETFTRYAGISATTTWERGEHPVVVHDDHGSLAEPVRLVLEAFQRDGSVLDLIRVWTAAIPLLESPAEGGDFRPSWLAGACEAMRAEENLRAGLPRMLKLAMVSHGHLARSMAAYYRTTPVEFISRSRLEHANVLLATTAEPIGRIAERCGFTSQSYFGRCFRQRYGQTPREYREHARRAVVP